MAEIDWQKMLGGMSAGSGDDAIKSVYGIMPTLDNLQMNLLFQAYYFINKYDLEDVREAFDKAQEWLANNKNLSFIGSKNLKDLLAAYTQNEYLRGIKVNTVNDVSSGSV